MPTAIFREDVHRLLQAGAPAADVLPHQEYRELHRAVLFTSLYPSDILGYHSPLILTRSDPTVGGIAMQRASVPTRTERSSERAHTAFLGAHPLPMLQRRCACGGIPGPDGACAACKGKRLARQQSVPGVPSTGTTPAVGYDFGQIPIHRPAGVRQTQLAINGPGDEYEQEADRLSERIMRITEPQLQSAPAQSRAGLAPQLEQEAQAPERLQIECKQASDMGQSVAPPIVHDVVRAPGQSLDPATRTFMEPRFGHDFSRVRVHTDAIAAQSAREVHAHAYTVGRNIVFAAGQYKPGTREGRQLLAHELAHVTQQEAAGTIAGQEFIHRKGDTKPQPPPPKPATPSTPAATPCVPKLKSFKAEITGSIGVRSVNGRCEVMLGTPGKANGTTFTSQVDVPKDCTGTLQYVQLTNMSICAHLTSGKDLRRKTGGDWIDTQDPIDLKPVSAAGAVEFSSNDSPGQPLGETFERVPRTDSCHIWLKGKPNEPANTSRVPLAMATWTWSADVKAKKSDSIECDKRWDVTHKSATGSTGKPTKALPAATKTVSPSDPPIEEGKC
jgi:hypothetical protein